MLQAMARGTNRGRRKSASALALLAAVLSIALEATLSVLRVTKLTTQCLILAYVIGISTIGLTDVVINYTG